MQPHVRVLPLTLIALGACTGSSVSDVAPDVSSYDATTPPGPDVIEDTPIPDYGFPFEERQPVLCGDATCSATEVCQAHVDCINDPNHPIIIPLPSSCVAIPPGCNAPCECPSVFCNSSNQPGSTPHCSSNGTVVCGSGC